jgi:hypothetical protein
MTTMPRAEILSKPALHTLTQLHAELATNRKSGDKLRALDVPLPVTGKVHGLTALHSSRFNLRRPHWWSLRSGLKTLSTFRLSACIIPIRANIVGPPSSATSSSASIAACHAARSWSAFLILKLWARASVRVTSWRPPGSAIGSSNLRDHPRLLMPPTFLVEFGSGFDFDRLDA